MAMDDQLEWLSQEAIALGVDLDGSIDDASRLELLFDKMADGKDKEYVRGLSIAFARWLGEIVRNEFGAKWILPLSDERVFISTLLF